MQIRLYPVRFAANSFLESFLRQAIFGSGLAVLSLGGGFVEGLAEVVQTALV